MKCKVCKKQEAIWAWQPFGPDECIDSFVVLGSHYRGFPIVKICNDCKFKWQQGWPLTFTYKGVQYRSTVNYIAEQFSGIPEAGRLSGSEG